MGNFWDWGECESFNKSLRLDSQKQFRGRGREEDEGKEGRRVKEESSRASFCFSAYRQETASCFMTGIPGGRVVWVVGEPRRCRSLFPALSLLFSAFGSLVIFQCSKPRRLSSNWFRWKISLSVTLEFGWNKEKNRSLAHGPVAKAEVLIHHKMLFDLSSGCCSLSCDDQSIITRPLYERSCHICFLAWKSLFIFSLILWWLEC